MSYERSALGSRMSTFSNWKFAAATAPSFGPSTVTSLDLKIDPHTLPTSGAFRSWLPATVDDAENVSTNLPVLSVDSLPHCCGAGGPLGKSILPRNGTNSTSFKNEAGDSTAYAMRRF